jgi:hypothetical protein
VEAVSTTYGSRKAFERIVCDDQREEGVERRQGEEGSPTRVLEGILRKKAGVAIRRTTKNYNIRGKKYIL